ncbi:tetratricopeptide repeat protein [Hwanghaeella sp.]|uniref:tetratricopeptide repeat protein n=1 Tax=Hwanghaeella sp. TaxID=2605943 RepID=UPI003CCBA7D9
MSSARKGLPEATARLLRTTALSAALVLSWTLYTGPAVAQQQQDELVNQVDEVTRRIQTDPFIRLRFVALALETPDEQGQALNGIVRAQIARGNIEDALKELRRIEDVLWQARSLAAVGDYYETIGERDKALDFLNQAVKAVTSSGEIGIGGADLLRVIAKKQAKLGQLNSAIASAERIPEPLERVRSLQQAASASFEDASGDPSALNNAKKVLAAAFEQAEKIGNPTNKTPHLFIDIGEAQASVGDEEGAQKTFRRARELIERGGREGRDRAYARLAGSMIFAGQLEEAMEVMRQVEEGPQQVRGVSSVARALADQGNVDAAVPLFTLAMEAASTIDNPEVRNAALGFMVREQTRVGRLADAFTTAGQIQERLAQSRALMGMAEELLKQNNPDAALVLVDYIPYISMRSQIFAKVAVMRGEAGEEKEAANLIARAFEPTGFEAQTEYIPDAIELVLNAHLQVGDPENDPVVFGEIRKLADLIDNDVVRVAAMSHLAAAEAERGDYERANRTLSSAWRNAWLNRRDPNFPRVLADIVKGQIAIGDILAAFDTAARIPVPEGEALNDRTPSGNFRAPRFSSLTRVAIAAAKTGEVDLAIRAAREMEHPPARAAGLAAVAVAIAEEEVGIVNVGSDTQDSDPGTDGGFSETVQN